MTIPFLDLAAASREVAADQAVAIDRVVASGWYVLGPEVERFERAFADHVGADHCVGVANGLDALRLSLEALGIGPGDEVIVPSHTFIATWLAVSATGARPVPVEPVPGSYVIEVAAVEAAITARTAAILPVHLYGQPADMPALARLAARRSLALVADAAQAHGARVGGHPVGAWGDASSWSFYPAKNLGALGDGGAITTDDAALAARLRRLRNYGSDEKYVHLEQGANSRLDELQAAVLRVRLARLDADNAVRSELAARYLEKLRATSLRLPVIAEGRTQTWHQFVVRTPQRDELRAYLEQHGVLAGVLYPVPIHRQPAYHKADLTLPVTEQACAEVLSLPLHPGLTVADVDTVCAHILAWTG